MKWLIRIAQYSAGVIYAICGLALLAFMVPATGLQAKTVATGSMTPAIPTGSLVIIQRPIISQLAVGDVVTYRKSPGSNVTITHRIVSIQRQSGIPYFVTKGDANAGPDLPIPGGAILGKVVWHAPYLGTITNSIKAPVALLLLVILPGLIIIVAESLRLRQLLHEPWPSGAGGQSAEVPVAFGETAPPRPEPQPPMQPESEPPASPPLVRPAPPPRRPAPRRRGLDGMTARKLVLAGVVLGLGLLGIGSTRAAIISNAVHLTGLQLAATTTPTPTPTPAPSPSPSPIPTSSPCPDITISHTGPGSVNTVTCTSTTSSHITNDNHVTVTTTNHQTAVTGLSQH